MLVHAVAIRLLITDHHAMIEFRFQCFNCTIHGSWWRYQIVV